MTLREAITPAAERLEKETIAGDTGASRNGDADKFDPAIHDQRTEEILDVFSGTAVAEKKALAPDQLEQLKSLEKAFATADVAELGRLVKELNAGDRQKAGRVLDTFRSDLFALGLANSVSGNEGMGWSLNLFRNQIGGGEQILSIDPTGKRSTDNYVRSSSGLGENSDDMLELGNVYGEQPVPAPEEFLRSVRQGRGA